jgi:hypothetical protein
MSRGQRFTLLGIAAAVAIVAVVIAVASGGGDGDGSSPTPAAGRDTGAPTKPSAPPIERIRVRGGQPVGGIREITVKKGEQVRIVVSSDTPQEIHMHGYDILKTARPGSPARFSFPAKIDGIFEMEVEGPGVEIAKLTVEP